MQADGGSIINITSSHAHRTMQGFFPYSVSKSGMEALTRALAVEYGPVGIRANSIAPGMIRSRHTEAVLAQYRDPAEAYQRILDSHPLRRIGDPRDIANAALFLASDESSFITGTTLFVDGGRHVQALNLNGSRQEGE
jgi:NAD(P)-dependent dehydrogenase (short-subunit alcohol dehydrogenase family)